MAYPPSLGGDFSLQFTQNGKTIYVDSNGKLQLAASIVDPASAVVSVRPQEELTKPLPAYLITVGGKGFVKYTAIDVPIVLVADAAQASPLGLTRHDDGTMTLWDLVSNHVLTCKDDTGVVFTELADPTTLKPTWKVAAATPAPVTSLGDTVYLKPIVDLLRADFHKDRGKMWNVSFDNTFPSDWFIATPKNAFGSYADLEMGIKDPNSTNDFNLKPKTPGEPDDPLHPAVALASSVTRPGGTPLVLHAGHSRAIFEEMYKVIIEAKHIVDICGMICQDATPTGQFLAALRNAITYLSNKPDAKSVKVRILFGMPMGLVGHKAWIGGTGPYQTAQEVLRELVRDVQSSSSIQVYLAYTTRILSCAWNHSKIVAVDGHTALVGGHNLWDGDYLWENPVCDVSMKLSGLAATDAQQWADYLWKRQVISGPRREWIGLLTMTSFVYTASFATPGRVFRTGSRAVPPAQLFTKFYSEPANLPARSSGSGIPTLSVARMEGTVDGVAGSDKALIVLLDSSTTSIHVSAQGIQGPFSGGWPDPFLNALGRALTRGVCVKIFMSDETNGGSYKGDMPTAVVTEIRSHIYGRQPSEIDALIANLTVLPFQPSSMWSQPAGTPGCRNHAKVMVVDGRVASIGSQNFYPSWPAKMSEFTYIFENTSLASEMIRDYFTPLEAWCRQPNASSQLET